MAPFHTHSGGRVPKPHHTKGLIQSPRRAARWSSEVSEGTRMPPSRVVNC